MRKNKSAIANAISSNTNITLSEKQAVSDQLQTGDKATYNKMQFVYNADTNTWTNKQGQPAKGLLAKELFKSAGFSADGKTALKPGLIQRAKDYMSGKTPGLAQATRLDPKASVGKKVAGIAGAAVGGALAKLAEPKKGQDQTQGQQAKGPKPVPGPTIAEIKDLQTKTLSGDLNSAKQLVNKLSTLKQQGYDVANFVQTAAPAMKRGGLAKSDPQAYATFAKIARSMRTEAYKHLSTVLEKAGISWSDIGYEVLISESVTTHVMLVPTKTIHLESMKKLAGI